MQTFLPYKDFGKTAKCLDYRRLGKQRVETLQIMNALAGLSSGWVNHPATLMWEGHEHTLLEYQIAIVSEWVYRGYNENVCLEKTIKAFDLLNGPFYDPLWLGDDRLHSSHRSNLLRKDYEYYSQFSWTEDDKMEYWWPTKELLNGTINI
jgi:hypothetical protein